MTDNKRFLTAQEVSDNFFNGSVSYWTVLQWAKSGALPSIRNGKRYIFDLQALEAWTADMAQRPYWDNAVEARR